MARWNNVRGEVTVYVNRDCEAGKELLKFFPEEEEVEVQIYFRSSGYRLPARLSGRFEDSCPAEEEDERTFWMAEVDGNRINDDLGLKIFEEFMDDIEAAEIDISDD